MDQSTQTPQWGSPTAQTSPRRRSPIAKLAWAGIVVVVAVVAWSIVASNSSDTSVPEADASTQLACEHFRNVVGDISGGLLTGDEIRVKIKQVYATGHLSSVPEIRVAAQDMLAALTTGSGEDGLNAFMDAEQRMDTACKTVGE